MTLNLVLAFAASLFFLIATCLIFRIFQNRKARMGGAISKAKAYWLGFVLCVWFIWPLLLLGMGELLTPWKKAWIVFSILLWLRALIETFMLTVTKNWRPPHGYGSHFFTAFCLALFSALHWQMFANVEQSLFWGLCVFTILLDAYYAIRFYEIVREKTVGDKGLWFAADGEERFIKINKLTLAFNVFITLWAMAFLLVAL